MKTLRVHCNHQNFILHPSGVAYWEAKRMLLIADVHLGKITHFRKHGSAIPQASLHHNFNQLKSVISNFESDTICFLGDLFHSYMNNEWLLFKAWIETLNCKVVLISGNHDIIDEKRYAQLGVEVLQEWEHDGFLLTHHPEVREGVYNFSGHIHPGVQLLGLGRQHLKLSCFHWKDNQMIFPAFGVFTGNYIIKPKSGERIFVNTEDEVLEIALHS
ncbi:ligase-associated DNA damage response endonuclease PdeM [Formosa sp. 3Alg 14/1]|uniref:ligase-associated DNA damage response endonuclease PdeM n=1 Tax=Formosa sp. 3Alg 14/1 TaxID=3382190 RepID=UPI0039BE5EC4